jgi:hypothetical protein
MKAVVIGKSRRALSSGKVVVSAAAPLKRHAITRPSYPLSGGQIVDTLSDGLTGVPFQLPSSSVAEELNPTLSSTTTLAAEPTVWEARRTVSQNV